MSRYDLVMSHRKIIWKLLREANCTDPKLFGSTARKEDTKDSDIDILFSPLENAKGLKIARAELELEKLFKTKVELVNLRTLRELFKPYILKEAIDI